VQKSYHKTSIFVTLAFICYLCLSGCSDEEEPEDDGVDIPVDPGLVSANTSFGFDLFTELVEQDFDKNVFISPPSVALTLAMVYNGASGETQQAMADALNLEGMTLEEVNAANKALIANLENPSKHVDINIANSLWMQEGLTFKPDFLQRNEDFYGAAARTLDFSEPGAVGTINNWVEEQTQGKIETIMDRINPVATLILVNALYFQGDWMVKFKRERTYPGKFTRLDGSEKTVQMMTSESDRYKSCWDKDFRAVSLPYGGGRVSMYIFLPDEDSSLEKFCQNLNAFNWEDWMSQFYQGEVDVHLPRFTTEYEIELNDTLKAMGMEVAFDPLRAEFEGMTSRPIWISEVRHRTFVEVNEEGTIAAAVTQATMEESEPMPFVVDRPFFCAIRDNQTGTVLFMGSIVDP
jgi:serine protease inhibitor